MRNLDKRFQVIQELSTEHATYLCRDLETNQNVVVRVFDERPELYFKLRQINSEHLPQIIAIKEEEHPCYVVEEFIDGCMLSEWSKKNPVSEELVLRWALELIEALQSLHAVGIIHRDIKLSNIMLREDLSLVLIDFSAAREYKESVSVDTTCLGTDGYAAPEQYGIGQSDFRTDMYAFGVLINRLLTGEYPYEKICKGPFAKVVQRCIKVNMDERYPSDQDLRQALVWVKYKMRMKNHAASIWGISLVAVLFMIGILTVFLNQGGDLRQREMNRSENVELTEEITEENERTVADEIPDAATTEITTEEMIDFSYNWNLIYYHLCSRMQEEWPEYEFLYAEKTVGNLETSFILRIDGKQIHEQYTKKRAEKETVTMEERLFVEIKAAIEEENPTKAVGLELVMDGENALFRIQAY